MYMRVERANTSGRSGFRTGFAEVMGIPFDSGTVSLREVYKNQARQIVSTPSPTAINKYFSAIPDADWCGFFDLYKDIRFAYGNPADITLAAQRYAPVGQENPMIISVSDRQAELKMIFDILHNQPTYMGLIHIEDNMRAYGNRLDSFLQRPALLRGVMLHLVHLAFDYADQKIQDCAKYHLRVMLMNFRYILSPEINSPWDPDRALADKVRQLTEHVLSPVYIALDQHQKQDVVRRFYSDLETVEKTVNQYVYHFTDLKDLVSIKNHGLSTDYSREAKQALFFSDAYRAGVGYAPSIDGGYYGYYSGKGKPLLRVKIDYVTKPRFEHSSTKGGDFGDDYGILMGRYISADQMEVMFPDFSTMPLTEIKYRVPLLAKTAKAHYEFSASGREARPETMDYQHRMMVSENMSPTDLVRYLAEQPDGFETLLGLYRVWQQEQKTKKYPVRIEGTPTWLFLQKYLDFLDKYFGSI
jgi:hypothetical protein